MASSKEIQEKISKLKDEQKLLFVQIVEAEGKAKNAFKTGDVAAARKASGEVSALREQAGVLDKALEELEVEEKTEAAKETVSRLRSEAATEKESAGRFLSENLTRIRNSYFAFLQAVQDAQKIPRLRFGDNGEARDAVQRFTGRLIVEGFPRLERRDNVLFPDGRHALILPGVAVGFEAEKVFGLLGESVEIVGRSIDRGLSEELQKFEKKGPRIEEGEEKAAPGIHKETVDLRSAPRMEAQEDEDGDTPAGAVEVDFRSGAKRRDDTVRQEAPV